MKIKTKPLSFFHCFTALLSFTATKIKEAMTDLRQKANVYKKFFFKKKKVNVEKKLVLCYEDKHKKQGQKLGQK